MNVSGRLQSLQNEIQALKMTQPLNGGALSKHSVVATWEGVIDKNTPISQYSILAAFEATFERSDGEVKTPLVQFAYSLDPGYTISGHITYTYSSSYVSAINDDSVVYKVVLTHQWWPFDEDQTTGNVKLTVYALSPVEGNLTLQRVYS